MRNRPVRVDDLHRSNRGRRTGVGREGRERRLSASGLDVVHSQTSREVRDTALREGRGLGNDLRAVDERALVDTEEAETAEDIGERLLELLLVVRERLPLASSARVTGDEEVGRETHLAANGREGFALHVGYAREGRALELSLDEELGVEDLRSGVEGRAWDRGVDLVGSGDGVCRKQPDNLEVLESNI